MMIRSWFSPFKFSSTFQDQLESYGIMKREDMLEEPEAGDVLIYPDLYYLTTIPNLRKFTEKDIDEFKRQYQSILDLQLCSSSYSQSSIFEALSKGAEIHDHAPTAVPNNQFSSTPGPISLLVCRLIFNNHQELLNIYSQVEANATSSSNLGDYFQGSYQDAMSTPSGQDMLNDWWNLQNIQTSSRLRHQNDLLDLSVQRLITIEAISDINKILREMIILILHRQTGEASS